MKDSKGNIVKEYWRIINWYHERGGLLPYDWNDYGNKAVKNIITAHDKEIQAQKEKFMKKVELLKKQIKEAKIDWDVLRYKGKPLTKKHIMQLSWFDILLTESYLGEIDEIFTDFNTNTKVSE